VEKKTAFVLGVEVRPINKRRACCGFKTEEKRTSGKRVGIPDPGIVKRSANFSSG